jgi:hypothetical protein
MNATVSPLAEFHGFFYPSSRSRSFQIASSMNGRVGGSFKKHTILQS